MHIWQWLAILGKLILCGLAFVVGTVLGGILASRLGLNAPTPPPDVDLKMVGIYMGLSAPLLALALAVIAPALGGGHLTRTLTLSFLIWIAYAVNTQLEASIVSTYATGVRFALVEYFVAGLLCGAAVAFLFPAGQKGPGLFAAGRVFFSQRPFLSWLWRLPLALVSFMPIYFVFGLLVLPFTGDYYRQSMFGLVFPTIDQLLPILFLRSTLFFLAILPIVILWQSSRASLFWRLGLALFLLVGFVYMLVSTWLPPYVRLPHTLEILADEFVYAGALVLLLTKGIHYERGQSHP